MSIAVHLSNLSKKFSRPALPRREWKLRSSWGQSNGIGFTRPVDEFVALEKVSYEAFKASHACRLEKAAKEAHHG